ncbi:MAG: TIGR04290 family methyltransferase [Chitinivibrionales bacterium]
MTHISQPENDTIEQHRQTIQRLKPWFHNLHLPEGLQTAPDHFLGDFPSYKWQEIASAIPESLQGWTALDIGCNAGFYSFELAKRGARVTAIDSDEHYLRQATWAAQLFGLDESITFERKQVHQLAHEHTQYDLILFLGVFYHLRYPLLALDTVCRKVKKLLVFQTLTMPEQQIIDTPADLDFNDRTQLCKKGWPHMAFVEKRLNHDPTNWWVPNTAAVEAMLRSCAMDILQRPGTETFLCKPDHERQKNSASWTVEEYEAATHT